MKKLTIEKKAELFDQFDFMIKNNEISVLFHSGVKTRLPDDLTMRFGSTCFNASSYLCDETGHVGILIDPIETVITAMNSQIEEFKKETNNTNRTKKLRYETVYLMLNKRNGYVKIGKSNNPTYREKTLQSEEPEIEIITYRKTSEGTEQALHEMFSNKRLRGEWFNLNVEDIELAVKEMECRA